MITGARTVSRKRYFMRSRVRIIAACLAIQVGTLGGALPPTFADPSAAPTTAPVDEQSILKSALVQLSDRDPGVREAAREQLMGLSATDLPALRISVEQMRPLPPGDADALRDIVSHVYLAGENSHGDASHGFVGITMTDWQSVIADDGSDSSDPVGVVVEMRLPGFDGYRMLRDGDIILSISAEGMEPLRVLSKEMVMATVRNLPAGSRVRLDLIRNGRRLETTVTLDPRPADLDQNRQQVDPADYRQALEAKAQAFWMARFASVVDDSIS
jgi:hypothetical protein